MRSIFLDVGAHNGQTAREVLKPHYTFTDIWCFEPVPAQRAALHALSTDVRFKVIDFGLSNRTREAEVYGDNSDMGASLYANMKKRGNDKVTHCKFVSATEFFKDKIYPTDLIVMKLNCEGSECDILNDLLDSGEASKIANVLIDFDVQKVPEKAHEEQALKERMLREGFKCYSLATEVMVGKTHQDRIANWLQGLKLEAEILRPTAPEPRKRSWFAWRD